MIRHAGECTVGGLRAGGGAGASRPMSAGASVAQSAHE